MGNDIAAQKSTQGLTFQVPAHIAARIKEKGLSNIADKVTTNQLTFGGKVWATHINGEKKILQRRNEEGDLENVQILRVVVLDYGKVRGRSYYEGTFDPNATKAPDCFSDDGRVPHASVAEPKHGSCETCPMAAKGSKVQDGKEMVACGQFRTLAVVPAADLKFPALRLKFSVTSDWDKGDDEAAASGWYAWSQYTDLLRANGLDFTGALVTRMRFSSNVNYPKLQFARSEEFLTDEQFSLVEVRAKSEEVQKLLSGYVAPVPGNTATAPKGRPLPKDDDAEADAAYQAKVKQAEAKAAQEAAATKAKAAAAEAEAEAAKKAEAAATRKRKAEAKAAEEKAAAEAAKQAAVPDDAGGWDEAPPSRAPKADIIAPPQPVEVPAALAGILGAWGD